MVLQLPQHDISGLSRELTLHSHSEATTQWELVVSLRSCQWSKGRAEFPPLLATGRWGSVLHFCQAGVGRTQRVSEHTHPAAHVLNLNRGLPAKRKRRLNRIQSLIIYYPKVSRYNFKNHSSKNQGNYNTSEKRHSMDANKEMNRMLELCDNYIKATIIKGTLAIIHKFCWNKLKINNSAKK